MPDTIFPFMCGICSKHFQSLVSYVDHFKDHQLNIINYMYMHNEKTVITGASPAQIESHNKGDKNLETVPNVCSFKCLSCHNELLGICKVQEHILLQDYLILTSNLYPSDKEKKCSVRNSRTNDIKTGSCIEREVRDNDNHHSTSTSRNNKEKLLSMKSSISKVGNPVIIAAIEKFIESTGSFIEKETLSRDNIATYNDGEILKPPTAENHENVYVCKEIFTKDNKTDQVSFSGNSSEAKNEQNETYPSYSETECKADNKINNESSEPQPSTSTQAKGDEQWSNKVDLIDITTNDIIINKHEEDSENIKESHENDDELDELTTSNAVNTKEVSVNIVNVDEFDGHREVLDDSVDVECLEYKNRKKVKRKAKCIFKADDKLPCDVCGILFSKKNLHRHRLSHTDVKTHRCNICNKYFKTKDQLYSHKLFHNTRKDQMCHFCGKAFNNGPNLRQHVKIHTREKTLKCPFCPKMFRSNFILKDHVNRHSDNKPFICEHCGKSFRTGNELQRHARVHSSDRPHLCSYCDKAFKSRSNRIKHEKTHQT